MTARAAALESMYGGNTADKVYLAAKQSLHNSPMPHLAKCLKKDVGFSTGIEFKDG